MYDPKVLDITDADLLANVGAGVRDLAALGLGSGVTNAASVPHALINGYKNVLALAVETEWSFPLADKVKAGDVEIVRYEGPTGGPGMQEMLYPTSYIKSKGLGKACALLTDGRFSGGTSGLSIGHASPEAAAGGAIGLVRNGDRIRIDIPNRSINVLVSDEEMAKRRIEQNAKGWKPAAPRPRKVSAALKAYAKLVMSADKGAVRDLSLLDD